MFMNSFELKTNCGGKREIQVFRELTKKFEENVGDNVDEVSKFFEDKEILGEITIVIKGVNRKTQSYELNKLEIKKELNELINAGLSLSAASRYLSKKRSL